MIVMRDTSDKLDEVETATIQIVEVIPIFQLYTNKVRASKFGSF